MGRKLCRERRNCLLQAISPFPTVFSKDLYCRQVKTRACRQLIAFPSQNKFSYGFTNLCNMVHMIANLKCSPTYNYLHVFNFLSDSHSRKKEG